MNIQEIVKKIDLEVIIKVVEEDLIKKAKTQQAAKLYLYKMWYLYIESKEVSDTNYCPECVSNTMLLWGAIEHELNNVYQTQIFLDKQ